MGGWSAGVNNAFQWLQIDLGRPNKVVRISTQGRPTVNQWVTSYYLLYSQDGVYFAFYFERNTKKVGFISFYVFLGDRNLKQNKVLVCMYVIRDDTAEYHGC